MGRNPPKVKNVDAITPAAKVIWTLVSFVSVRLRSSPAQNGSEKFLYKDPSQPLEKRVDDLIAKMTLEEKVSQLGHTADAIPRLGVPEYNWWNEGLHGVARAGYATVFPQAIGMAATFDEPLMHEVADVISTEFRAKYTAQRPSDGSADWYRGLTVWSPNINIFRDPRWGRGQETYGEDPYLTSRIGRRVRHRPAGRRSQVPQGRRDAEALRGSQRTGIDAAHGEREGLTARSWRTPICRPSARR